MGIFADFPERFVFTTARTLIFFAVCGLDLLAEDFFAACFFDFLTIRRSFRNNNFTGKIAEHAEIYGEIVAGSITISAVKFVR
jgi:hypothetical protein